MRKLSNGIMELLGISLGIGESYFRDFYKDNDSTMRLNYFPPCRKPEQTLGTGPHCDPTSLTILRQDNVGGREVFVEEKWHSIAPCSEAFVINIKDTFIW
ncbi:putative oxoglutarate/iron-dependent dioxygenase, isopenicillin N synthase [Helianthus debilis subsp. tardiflorus]